eukprot:PhF_6_TR38110/c0_g1_i1/m.56877
MEVVGRKCQEALMVAELSPAQRNKIQSVLSECKRKPKQPVINTPEAIITTPTPVSSWGSHFGSTLRLHLLPLDDVAFGFHLTITNEFGLSSKEKVEHLKSSGARLRCRATGVDEEILEYELSCTSHTSLLNDGRGDYIVHVMGGNIDTDLINNEGLLFELVGAPEVLPVATIPKKYMADTVGAHAARILHVKHNKQQIFIAEAFGDLGIAGRLWDGALCLIRYLESEEGGRHIKGKRVWEIGSGTGAAGIATALLGANYVTITDLPDAVPLMQLNIDLNRSKKGVLSDNIRVLAFPWGMDGEAVLDGTSVQELPEIVVCSDVVYEEAWYEDLMFSFTSLARRTDGKCEFFMAHTHRNPADEKFFEMLRNKCLVMRKSEEGSASGESFSSEEGFLRQQPLTDQHILVHFKIFC